ncbi:MAG: type II toxin-antitoxin system prevent-host-death family antitoxin [Zoogloeaceae bacterium]|nr:type II toxin-antitoxin system prevent-host-death family antitoxin [Zoogloeaceae bacterium]
MAVPLRIDALEVLPRTPASDVKRLGWRGVMKAVASVGKVVVTHHNEPEAVILSTAEYAAIARALEAVAAQNESALDELRRRFDERLAVLAEADASDRLRGVMAATATLGGAVKAGASY